MKKRALAGTNGLENIDTSEFFDIKLIKRDDGMGTPPSRSQFGATLIDWTEEEIEIKI